METEVNAYLSKLGDDRAHSESTQQAYANDLRVFLRYLDRIENHTPGLHDLNTEQVANFLSAEGAAGHRRSTLIRRLATLRYFQEYLVENGTLDGIRFSAGDRIIQQVISEVPEKKAINCLTEEQVQELLEIMESSNRLRALRDRAIFMLLLETGLSVANLTALDMTDIDLAAKRFHINLEGEGDVWLGLGEAVKPIEDYITDGRPNLLHEPGEAALFISQMDGRLSRQGVWQLLKFWGDQTDPPVPLSPRLVRHRAVLRMQRSGLTLTQIQLRLGHSSLLSTQALIRRLEANC
jgi:integrase/recombinase XerD